MKRVAMEAVFKMSLQKQKKTHKRSSNKNMAFKDCPKD